MWFYCVGCGPTMKCPVCGATECAQNFDPVRCHGCMQVKDRAQKEGIPWNVRPAPRNARPPKHVRQRESKNERHRRMFRRCQYTQYRPFINTAKPRTPRRVRAFRDLLQGFADP